jgi:hypothetical protein
MQPSGLRCVNLDFELIAVGFALLCGALCLDVTHVGVDYPSHPFELTFAVGWPNRLAVAYGGQSLGQWISTVFHLYAQSCPTRATPAVEGLLFRAAVLQHKHEFRDPSEHFPLRVVLGNLSVKLEAK